jgi:hypothetical protein
VGDVPSRAVRPSRGRAPCEADTSPQAREEVIPLEDFLRLIDAGRQARRDAANSGNQLAAEKATADFLKAAEGYDGKVVQVEGTVQSVSRADVMVGVPESSSVVQMLPAGTGWPRGRPGGRRVGRENFRLVTRNEAWASTLKAGDKVACQARLRVKVSGIALDWSLYADYIRPINDVHDCLDGLI